jgi:hypothetical protein
MAETLYVVLKSGEVLTVDEVTALELDSSKTISPGDFYRNEWIEQEVTIGDLLLTKQKGDQVTPSGLRNESWLCSFWKLTRGANLPILYFKWADVDGICNLLPDAENAAAQYYVPLVSGRILVYSGVGTTGATTGITINTAMTVYPGDYFRNVYVEQTAEGSPDQVVTEQYGDARDGDALNPETWTASHYEFTRPTLLTLYAPWSSVRGGPSVAYPIA